MRAKIEKANHVVMFETAGEFYAHEVTQGINVGFFACPSCGVKCIPNRIISFPVTMIAHVFM
ncbi:hypothetical protein F6Y05_32990 (plasmid) [Bacillus megaterium]|nr:hypothetical protein [Priestia megaterium]